jgi:hypothetical protein
MASHQPHKGNCQRKPIWETSNTILGPSNCHCEPKLDDRTMATPGGYYYGQGTSCPFGAAQQLALQAGPQGPPKTDPPTPTNQTCGCEGCPNPYQKIPPYHSKLAPPRCEAHCVTCLYCTRCQAHGFHTPECDRPSTVQPAPVPFPRPCCAKQMDMECDEPSRYRCASCRLAYYCSRQCQKDAWPAHRAACQQFRCPPGPLSEEPPGANYNPTDFAGVQERKARQRAAYDPHFPPHTTNADRGTAWDKQAPPHPD